MIRFSIRLAAGRPISEQLVFAAKRAIATGQLQPGDRFPSVRELSQELKINPNTAQKAIAELQREKLLLVTPGVGTTVAELPPGSAADRMALLDCEVGRLVVEAKSKSISKKEVLAAVEHHWKEK